MEFVQGKWLGKFIDQCYGVYPSPLLGSNYLADESASLNMVPFLHGQCQRYWGVLIVWLSFF